MTDAPLPGWRRRPPSLRTRVAAAAALGTVVVAVVVTLVVSTLLTRRETAALDDRLDLLSGPIAARVDAGLDPGLLLGRAGPVVEAALGDLVITVRTGDRVRTVGVQEGPLPALPARTGNADGYRVRTVPVSGGTVTVGLPTAGTERTVSRVRRLTVLIAALATLAAAAMGWLLAGRALRPLRELRDRTAALDPRPGAADRTGLAAAPVDRTAETAELAHALSGLLERVDRAQSDGARALAAARDFAAAADHELRTPLTALRTDIEVLAAHPELPADQRAELLASVTGSRERLESTLAALASLASGELAAAPADLVELTDLVASAVAAVVRIAPAGVTVTAELPAGEVVVTGTAAGLRLAVDNLLLNALRHAGGSRVVAAVRPAGNRVVITVDDDGTGVPADERAVLFERFRRGRGARAAGSGLGLALVAQQAALHGGSAALAVSPLGGTRAVLDLPAGPPR